ncbi:dipeptidase [Roseibium suaedae]|uniref:Membrane dipeptidase n=1 Tax=Roseibium suaedae TaxID=735517 RepID=A0A1M7BJG5_9HYPH|nr:dipeptidase [Roseibium suaedae]SHL55175.1 membrane dipeptidase [Roseibium suaedae]
MNKPIPVFDGHNDTLLKFVLEKGTAQERSFFTKSGAGHIDLPRCLEGGLAGGLFAMFVPSNTGQDFSRPYNPADPANYAEVDQAVALNFTSAMIAMARKIERASQGQVRICRSAAEIRKAMEEGSLAVSLHIEGAEAIDKDFNALETLQAAGLRSLGPVWSRKNIFADGVPMAFPSSPDTGPGLTDTGMALVKACNDLGILIDLSHLNEKGFWDVARTSRHPLVASHSNAHAICASARNLTDRQLDAIRDTGGLAGINFHVAFLREDGRHDRTTPLETIARHAAYLVEKLGEDHVGLGSDFDGCMLPLDLKDVSGLPRLIDAFREAGFGEELIEKIAWKNWLDVLERTQSPSL